MATYFVRMRDFERRLLRDAIEAGGDIASAAEILGVTAHYVKAHAKLLGGVLPNDPVHEPPGLAAHAWNNTAPSGSRVKAQREAEARNANSEAAQPDQTENADA